MTNNDMRTYDHDLCDERHGRLDSELRHFEDKAERVELCTVKLTQIIERHDKQIDLHEKRINRIERHSGVQFERLIWYTISALLGALAAAATDHFVI